MKKGILSFFLFASVSVSILRSQSAVPATGTTLSGSGGSVSYSVGQTNYTTISGINGTVAQGVQQAFEISVVTSVRGSDGINLEMVVFPNPTKGKIKLLMGEMTRGDLRIQVFDINGLKLIDRKIEEKESEIEMDTFSASTYILKVIRGNGEIKTFKIIKF